MLDVSETADLASCLALRMDVFVREQGVPEHEERDAADDDAIHFIARWDGAVVGTARLIVDAETGWIGRVCVHRAARGRGIGVALIKAAIERLRAEPGVAVVALSAQLAALAFYERLGFTATGPVYDDAGIPHRRMTRPLRFGDDGGGVAC